MSVTSNATPSLMSSLTPPLIGITTYGRNADDEFTLPAVYVESVRRAGGIPILIPPGENQLDALLTALDGLIISGGGDIDPAHYGSAGHPTVYMIDAERDATELTLARQVASNGMPTLCICRGLQLLNVALGGTLIEHLPDVVSGEINHRQEPDQPTAHNLTILPNTRLAALIDAGPMHGISWHHQAIRTVAPSLVVAARAADGTVEAVEAPDHPWLIATQWHPEMSAATDPRQQHLFDEFVQAVQRARAQRHQETQSETQRASSDETAETLGFTYTNEVVWLPNGGWDERIHIAANDDLVNVFLLVTARYVVLIDTLFNPTTAQALVDYAQPYLATRQLFVINSHADWDHAWGNQLFAGPNAPHPAPILAHAECARRLADPATQSRLEEFQREKPQFFNDVRLTVPTHTFTDTFTLDCGDLTLQLFSTPGHTEDHISIYIPEIRTVLAGDAAEIPFPMVSHAADLPVLRASLAKLAALNPTWLLCCHAPPESPASLLHDNLAYYHALEAACRAALRRGLNVEHIPDAELPAALHCHFRDITPTTGAWAELPAVASTTRHGQQLRLMLEWVQSEKDKVE